MRYIFRTVILLPALICLAAVGGPARQGHGFADGLYAIPDGDAASRGDPDAVTGRDAKTYLNSLDPESQRIAKNREKILAARKAAATAASAKSRAAQDAAWMPGSLRLSEEAWIAILGTIGLLASFTVAGIVWRMRAQSPRTAVVPFLSRGSVQPAAKAETARQETPRKRAA